jgi:hypothetical protein
LNVIAFVILGAPKQPKNAVSVLTESYTAACPLIVEPQPNTQFRYFMLWREAAAGETLRPQELKFLEAVGLPRVEWGRAKIGTGVGSHTA